MLRIREDSKVYKEAAQRWKRHNSSGESKNKLVSRIGSILTEPAAGTAEKN